MFYGVIIAFGALLYLVWKLLFAKSFRTTASLVHDGKDEDKSSAKESSQETKPDIDQADNVCNKIESLNLRRNSLSGNKSEPQNAKSNEYLKEERDNKRESNEITISQALQKDDPILNIQKIYAPILEEDRLITPSLLLKQQNEKKRHEEERESVKRISPPKERFAEFVEKTVLNDDKLQSIIQNLSLNECKVEPITTEENLPHLSRSREESPFTERAAELQKSIDEIADRVKRLNEINSATESEPESKENDLEEKESKPLLLRRLEKQTGMPTGLNFGSVIGELKLKTRNSSNGGLKPVFKKFDSDATVDQACFNTSFFLRNLYPTVF